MITIQMNNRSVNKKVLFERIMIVLLWSVISVYSNLALSQDTPQNDTKKPQLQAIKSIEKASVIINGIPEGLILSNVLSSVELYQRSLMINAKNSIEVYDWQRLISVAEVQIKNALKPYGYYLPKLTRSASTEVSNVVFEVDLGEPVILTDVVISLNGAAKLNPTIKAWLASYPLKAGDVLVQPSYDSAKSQLNQILRRFGYLDAEFVTQEIVINTDRTKGKIILSVDSGERYQYGEFEIVWLSDSQLDSQAETYSQKFLSRYLTLQSGDDFDSQILQETQREMASSTYFSSVEFRPFFNKAEAGRVPVRVTLQAPKRLAYSGSLGFGTDSGPRVGITFENRRINTLGHRLNSELNASTEKQTIVMNYAIPSSDNIRNGLNLFTSFVNEDSDVRDSRLWLTGFDFNNSLSERTQLSYGLSFRDERFVESDQQLSSQLLLPSVTWQTINADDLRNPNRGYRISANLRVADDSLASDISFAQLTLNAKSVYSLGRGRLLSRVQISRTFINDDERLPSSLLFFTGGDHSVRGYGFETIGIIDDDGELLGGQNVVATSIEYEQQVKGAFALAAFIDAGDAYDESLDLKVGIGIGARWRLPFGAVRVDIASARDLEGEPLRLHFTFGTDL